MIKRARLENLYSLKTRLSEESSSHMDVACEYGWFTKEEIDAHDKVVEIDGEYKRKCDELTEEVGIADGLLAIRLLDAIFPKSMSRYVKCLEICGVEVIGQ